MLEEGKGGINGLCPLTVVLSHVDAGSTSLVLFVTADTGPKYLAWPWQPTTCFSLPPCLSTFQVCVGQSPTLPPPGPMDHGLLIAFQSWMAKCSPRGVYRQSLQGEGGPCEVTYSERLSLCVREHFGATLFVANWEPSIVFGFVLKSPSLWPQFGATPYGLILAPHPLGSDAASVTEKTP